MIGAEPLAGLRRALDQLAGLTNLGRDQYDADELVRLAIQRIWINVGNHAETYRLSAGIAAGAQPWSEMYSVLAHMLPEEINDDRVWFETVDGVERLRSELANVR